MPSLLQIYRLFRQKTDIIEMCYLTCTVLTYEKFNTNNSP